MEDKKQRSDAKEKQQVEKQGAVGNNQPSSQNNKQSPQDGGLTKDELPDATNESTGKMGSGQRQDSN